MKFKFLAILLILFIGCNEWDAPTLENNVFTVIDIQPLSDGRINVHLQSKREVCDFWMTATADFIDLGDSLTIVKYDR